MGIWGKKKAQPSGSPEVWTELYAGGKYFRIEGTQTEAALKVAEAKRHALWLVADQELLNPYAVVGIGETFMYHRAGGIKRLGLQTQADIPLY